MEKVFDVIVIGCGPAGISAAVEAQALGLDTLVLEKGEAHSQSIRKFYKEGKRVDKDYKGQVVELKGKIDLKDGNRESTLSFFDEVLNDSSVEYHSDVESIVESGGKFVVTTSDNRSFHARFVVVCIGKMGQPNKPSYTLPSSVRKQINFNANDAKKGERILVVGGGNSAVEYAIDLANLTDTTLNYRRSEFSRINDTNASELETSIASGKLKTILGVDIQSLEDDNGNILVHFTNGEKKSFERVIYAIGGASPLDFLRKCHIEVDEKGTPLCSEINESSVKNCFIAGDIALKSGGSIAIALNHGYDIAQEIKKRV